MPLGTTTFLIPSHYFNNTAKYTPGIKFHWPNGPTWSIPKLVLAREPEHTGWPMPVTTHSGNWTWGRSYQTTGSEENCGRVRERGGTLGGGAGVDSWLVTTVTAVWPSSRDERDAGCEVRGRVFQESTRVVKWERGWCIQRDKEARTAERWTETKRNETLWRPSVGHISVQSKCFCFPFMKWQYCSVNCFLAGLSQGLRKMPWKHVCVSASVTFFPMAVVYVHR